ncbi:serine/threonine protein kinase [Nannocystis bainbridge]|uniref:Protein kinase domain-containing protein n=1 Tax=Nannocystis bainbridge TaxID=2995303 RepID=A0ABT5E5U7_9BACT|nr:hypothetical protein [Nannocystis bainbridge]MDC0720136.1 hypothetical protein [Nannocystis bainbridge]
MTTATTGAPTLSPGTVIDGTYTLGAVVRERDGSVSYEATDLGGSRVEVTVYAAGCFVSPVALERSLRELRQLEKVQSPHIVRVIDTGKMSQGGIYEVHERLDGVPLANAGSIAPGEVVGIVEDVAVALAAAQKVGVVHRNLGAASILRSGSDVRLFNFAVGDPQGGVSFGAIDCIAPEQVEGKNIDERTLVYNLAALTYRLLKGQSLFTTEDTGTALLQHAASLPPESSMPAPLFAGLAKDPKARPALTKFLGDLGDIVRDFPRDQQDDPMHDPDALDPDRAAPSGPAATPTPEPAPVAPAAAKPAIAAPPSVGPKLGAPPLLAPPSIGKPPGVAAPTLSAPTFAPPGVNPPSLSAPNLAAPPAATPSASAGAQTAKPRTRGWTMFMEATDGESGGAAAPGVPMGGPSPVAPAPMAAPAFVAAPTPAPAPVQPAAAAAPVTPTGEVKPSTRGWTMIMDEPEADAAALAVTTPAAASAPAPASPTTRGWTMLEELNDSLPGAPPPTAAAPAPAPEKAAEPAAGAAGGAPSSRGWTMFMEAELQGKEEPKAEPPATDPEFYDGQVTTDSGTVVAFAPTAAAQQARPRASEPAADLPPGTEEMTSFGSRFRGSDPEPAAPAEAAVPQPPPDLPSFAGNSSFDFGGLTAPPKPQSEPAKPTVTAATPANPPESVFATAEAAEGAGGGSKALIIVIVVLVIAAVAVLALTST